MRRFKLVALFKVVALFGLVLLSVGASSPAAAQSSAAYVPTVARGQDFELSLRHIFSIFQMVRKLRANLEHYVNLDSRG